MSRDATPLDVIEGRARWCVVCADNRDVLPTLPKVDAVVTDPPYGIADIWQGGVCGSWGKFRDSAETERRSGWDSVAPSAETMRAIVSHGDDAIVWGGNYFELAPARGWLVWDKMIRAFSTGHCELAWTTLDQPVRAFNYSHGQLASEGKDAHPTQKPLPLMLWCLGFLPDAIVVLDPFCGSGTTGVACLRLGRRFIGIEKDAHYAEVARERLEAESRGLTLRDARAGQLSLLGENP